LGFPLRNYYTILGLSRGASDDDVRKAYRSLARKYHPDSSGNELGREEKFKEVSEAYRALKDAYSRELYHEQYDKAVAKKQANLFQTAQHSYQEEAARSAETLQKMRQPTQKSNRFQDTASTNQAAPRPKFFESLKQQVSDLSKSAGDTLFRNREVIRPKTSGSTSGLHSTEPINTARVSIFEVVLSTPEAIQGAKRTVQLAQDELESSKPKKILIRIPPGTADGTMLRLRSADVPNEELVVMVHVQPHATLTVSRKGIIIEVPISPSEAFNGAAIQVPTFDDPVLIKIPPGSQSGQELRLRGKGIRYRETPGDLIVRLMIKNPIQTSVDQRSAITSIGADYANQLRSEALVLLPSLAIRS
jgi:DnaJ-class molecular chaperone